MSAASPFRFGNFELDLSAYELRRAGAPIRLERRPMELLILLVERHHQLVTRNDIVARLWGPGVFVDTETGVNTAIRKVRRALGEPRWIETVPGKGYRFVADIGGATATSAFPSPAITLAVLPFDNLGGGADLEYLADGFTEEAITALGQIDPERLRVIGRTSVMSYKRSTKSLADIGTELGATYLLEGSMRAERDRWRITSKLIRVPEQVQIWSASFDSAPSSMLEFQRELTTAIAAQIRLHLSPQRFDALERRQSRSPEAYDIYLRGRYLWNQLTAETNRRAVEHFARATEIDPQYALAWSGLADAYGSSPINADAPPMAMRPLATNAAMRAMEADPELPETQTSLGIVKYWFDWDWVAAEAAYRKAIGLDPTYVLAYRMLGVLLGSAGRSGEARDAMTRTRELDPLMPMNHALSAHIAFLGRDYGTGLQFARQAVAVGPQFWIGHFQYALNLEQTGDLDAALTALKNADSVSSGNSKMISLRGYILAKLGRTSEAREVLDALRSIARERYVPPYAMALVNAGLEDRDAVFEWLDRALAARDVHLIWLLEDAKWDPFRSDRRFQTVIEKCGWG